MNKQVVSTENENRTSIEIEYSEIHGFLKHLLDYRATIFNFAVISNSALLTVVLTYSLSFEKIGRILLSIFGLGISIIFLMAEKRTMQTFGQYLTYAKTVENKLGIGVLSFVQSEIEGNKFSLRRCFKALYILMMLIWFVVLIQLFAA